MKTPFLSVMAVLLATSSPSLADPSARADVATEDKLLTCELSYRGTGRILDGDEAPVPAPSAEQEPILFLLSYGEMIGTVKDSPALDQNGTPLANERSLELTLKHDSGNEWGVSRATARYRLDQTDLTAPLAEATLATPRWGREMALRCFLVSASPVSARGTTTTEYGRGDASGTCDGSNGHFCIDQLKRRARDEASRDAAWQCQLRGGRADSWSASCHESCNPFSLPYDAPPQTVRCSSNCSVRCERP